MKKYVAVNETLFGEKYKYYDTEEDAKNDKTFLFDALFMMIYPKSKISNEIAYYDIIKKALKVFDIFKSFEIDVYHTRHNDTGCELRITDYDGESIYKEITKEEFDLLQEVLE